MGGGGGGGGGTAQTSGPNSRTGDEDTPATKHFKHTVHTQDRRRHTHSRVLCSHNTHTHGAHRHTRNTHMRAHKRNWRRAATGGTERACFAEATEKNWPDDGERCEATHTRRRWWRWRRRPDGRSGRKRCGTRYARNDGTIPSVRLRRFFGGTKTPAVAAVEARARAPAETAERAAEPKHSVANLVFQLVGLAFFVMPMALVSTLHSN